MNTCFASDDRLPALTAQLLSDSDLPYTSANMEEAAGVAMDYINSEYLSQ